MKLSVIAHPNAKNPRIEKDLLGTLHVYVSQPPLDGKANDALIDALVEHFNLKRKNIFLLSGHKSKNKLFEILS